MRVTPVVNDDLTALNLAAKMVGVSGFEPPAPASRRQCSTRLSYTPAVAAIDANLSLGALL